MVCFRSPAREFIICYFRGQGTEAKDLICFRNTAEEISHVTHRLAPHRDMVLYKVYSPTPTSDGGDVGIVG